MKDLRCPRPVPFFRIRRRFFAIRKPSEWQYIGIDIPGQLGNGREAKAVLEYGGDSEIRRGARLLAKLFETLLVIDAA